MLDTPDEVLEGLDVELGVEVTEEVLDALLVVTELVWLVEVVLEGDDVLLDPLLVDDEVVETTEDVLDGLLVDDVVEATEEVLDELIVEEVVVIGADEEVLDAAALVETGKFVSVVHCVHIEAGAALPSLK